MDTQKAIRLAARLLRNRPYEDNVALDDLIRESAIMLRTLAELHYRQVARLRIYADARKEAGLADQPETCACCQQQFLPDCPTDPKFPSQCPPCVLQCRVVEGKWQQGKYCPARVNASASQ